MVDTFPILPTLNGFSIKKKPIFATGVTEFIYGNELQAAQQAFPLWEFDLTYEILSTTTNNQVQDTYFNDYQTQYESVLVIFLLGLGQAEYFLYDDPSDDSRTGQFIATADGVTTTFRLIRTWYTGATSMNEPIGMINQFNGFQFYDNGSPVSPTVDAAGENITFASPPTAGHTITGDFFFFYKCRFIEDTASFDEFFKDRWSNKALKFRSVKTSPQIIGATPVLPVNNWSVTQLELPDGWTLSSGSFSYGCLARNNNGYMV